MIAIGTSHRVGLVCRVVAAMGNVYQASAVKVLLQRYSYENYPISDMPSTYDNWWIWHDGQGACLFAKRLERGRFIWPSQSGGAVHLTPAQLGYLLEGIDWRAPQTTWRPEIAG